MPSTLRGIPLVLSLVRQQRVYLKFQDLAVEHKLIRRIKFSLYYSLFSRRLNPNS
jgi:hypothetical protein